MNQKWEEKDEKTQSIEELTSKLNSVTDCIPGGVGAFLYAEKTLPISINRALAGMLDYTKEEYLELFHEDATITVYPEDLPRLKASLEKRASENCKSECTIRLIRKDGTPTWVDISSQKTGEYQGYGVFFNFVSDVNKRIENEQIVQKAYETMQYRASHDSLTGICNRDNFYAKVRTILDQNPEENYVILRWNIERFKVINDLFGMDTGDQILKEIAQLLKNTFHEVGAYARLEADHFALFYPENFITPEELLRLSDEKFHEYQKNYSVMCSIGIYRIEDPSIEVNQMCDRANMAYQTIRGNYIKRYAYYDANLRNAILQEQEITGEMDKALKEGQFEVFIQPIFGVISNIPESGEALIRWRHPEKGLLSPGVFIPLFEKNGFITKLDYYVWETTCENIHRRMIDGLPMVPISVNVSRMNLYNPNLAEEISALTEKYRIPNHMLKLEITESAYMDNPKQLIDTTKKLQDRGFRILMDDFGSGYSSLNMLKELPVDILKIDMKFIDDLDRSKRAGSVVTSVVRMARWLDMQIVAEGVETKSQLDFLRAIGCECVQGFYFAKPMPLKDFNALLEENKRAELKDDMSKILEEFDFDAIWTNQKIAILFNGIIQGMAFYAMEKGKLSLIRANDGFYEMLGENVAAMQKTAEFAKVIGQDEELLAKTCARAQQSGQIETVVVRREHNDGHIMWIETKIRFLGYREKSTLFYLAMNEIGASMRSTETISEHTEQLKELLQDEEYIVECARTLSSIHDEDIAINQVLERLLNYYQAERSYVFEFDWKNGKAPNTYEKCAAGITPEIMNLQDVDIDALSFWIDQFSNHTYVYIPSVSDLKEKRPQEWEYLAPQNIHSLMAVPFYNDKTIIGFIGVDNPAIERDKPHFLINITYFISNEIQKRIMHKKLRKLSYYDGLTGLYNRNRYQTYEQGFMNTLRHQGAGMVFLDVNGLKQINDSKGHIRGDERIQATANIMREAFPDDLLFRLSGDEFLVVCDDCGENEFWKKEELLERLNSAEGDAIASIGAVWKAHPGSIEELSNAADIQMYLQKESYYQKHEEFDRRKRDKRK